MRPLVLSSDSALSWKANSSTIVALSAFVLLFSAGLVLTDSFILPVGVIAIGVGAYFLSTEVRSIVAFVLMDLVLAYRGRWQTDAGGISGIETAIGVLMLAIIGIWIVRIRIIENGPLSHHTSMLAMVLFFVWSLLVTLGGLALPHHTFEGALREILNLVPLLILPILYYRGIESGDPIEKRLLQLVVVGGIVVVLRSLYVLKSSVVKAFYLFQTGRASNDALLAVFLVLLAVSFLMSRTSLRSRVGFVLLLMFGLIGVIGSFSRAIYLGCVVASLVVIALGIGRERFRGARGSLLALFLLAAGATPIILRIRILKLMILRYADRFVSSTHVTTDKSMIARYVEWDYLWRAITESPLLGHGFGAQFHLFDVLLQQHSWLGFSHSSYLYLAFKTGLVGFVLFFFAFLSFVVLGFRLSRNLAVPEPARAVVRAGVGLMIAFLLDCYASPDLDSKIDLIWIGLVWGYLLVVARKYQPLRMTQHTSLWNQSSRVSNA